jgi:hypothetical protein
VKNFHQYCICEGSGQTIAFVRVQDKREELNRNRTRAIPAAYIGT